jgi:zinc transport system substrate-binding protein
MRRVFVVLVALALAASANAAPRVAADIAPVHSIVARVMAGIGAPDLVVGPGASEHGYALRPSEARLLQEADLVVWVGPDLTPWLGEAIASLAVDAAVVTLEDAPGIERLPLRDGGAFEPHGHGPVDAAGHDHPVADGHLWLDPRNAVAAARAVAAALGGVDPANAAGYAANAAAFADEMAALSREIAARLAPVRGRPYIVFHDAFQYFEHGFDLPAAGSVALPDGSAPGAARVAEVRARVRAEGIVCAFAEPQFEPRLLATVIDGTAVRTGVLDPIGATLSPGPELYPALLRGLAEALAGCLGG